MHYYFAYGANTNLTEMLMRCPEAKVIGNAYLDGYTFRWRKYADIEISTSDEYVIGVLWELNDNDLSSLDEYEGYPLIYFRQRVIINKDNKNYTSWVYMMTNQNVEIEPDDDYKELLFEGYRQNNISSEQLIVGLNRFLVE